MSSARPRQRILVIDDEQHLANLICSALTGWGYAVDVAYTGREGIEKLSARDYHIVVCDLKIGDMDAFEVMRSMSDHRRVGFIIITGHVSAESIIEALHQEAFDYLPKPFEMDVLRSAISRAMERVEAERFRDDMIAMISHDIKIPLSSIIGYSSVIFDRATGELNQRARDFVQTINLNAQKILSLIDNFLTSCKIDSGRLVLYPREVDVNFIIEDLLCAMQVELERHKVKLETTLEPKLPPVMGDENLLFRAICNMLSNAVKYTPEEGRITLRTGIVPAAHSPMETPSLVIEMTNEGPGIPAHELATIFDKYSRSANHRGIEGSGIGTYVLRYVVEAHGGRVQVVSTPNALTTFSIFLPIAPTQQSQEG